MDDSRQDASPPSRRVTSDNPRSLGDLLQAIVRNVACGCLVWAGDRIIHANQAFAAMVDVPLERLLMWRRSDLENRLPIAGGSPGERAVESSAGAGTPASRVNPVIRVGRNPSGEERRFEFRSTAVAWDGNEAVIEYVTEVAAVNGFRLQAESAATNRAAIVEPGDEISFAIDAAARITAIDTRITRFGYLPDDLLGQSIGDLVATDDRARFLAVIEQTIRNGGEMRTEFRLRGRSGDLVWCENFSLARNRSPGESAGLTGILRDITRWKRMENALRESEQRFRTLAANVPIAIFIHRGGKFLYCNQTAVEVSGYSLEELAGLDYWQLAAPELWPSIRERGELRLARENPPSRYILPFIRKDGQRRFLDLTSGCVDIDGKPEIIGAGIDVTDRIETENKLRQSLEQNKVLLREVHHRVKNNLQVISSLLHLQSLRIEDSAARESFRQCQLRIKSMALVHASLYHHDRIEAIDFTTYLDELLDNLFTVYGRSRERIRLVKQIEAFPLEIDQVINCGLIFNELISNALKHAFPDERPGELFIGFTRSGNDQVVVTLRDNGVGLPEDFDLTTVATLGLVLVQSVTEQLNGVLTLRNQGGTEFTIIFPLAGFSNVQPV